MGPSSLEAGRLIGDDGGMAAALFTSGATGNVSWGIGAYTAAGGAEIVTGELIWVDGGSMGDKLAAGTYSTFAVILLPASNFGAR